MRTKTFNVFKNSKRARFNAKDYLKKNVINKEGKAVIPISLKSKEEMFNKHDPRGITLSRDIREYIDEIAYDIPYGYDITLEIHCPNINEEDKKVMERVIKLYYGLEITGTDEELKISKRRSRIMYAIGIVATIAMFFTITYCEESFLELLSLILWFTLWEGIDETIYTQGDLRYERMDAEQIYKGRVKFFDAEDEENEKEEDEGLLR